MTGGTYHRLVSSNHRALPRGSPVKKFTCIPARAVFDLQLQPALLRTLLVLGLYTDKRGRCYVKVATVAQVLGTHPKNAQKYLRLLERAGYLRRVAQHCSNGRQRENAYELVLGGESSATPPGGVVSDSPHKERVLERVQEPGPGGPVEEDMRSESDSCNDGLVIDVRDHPTKPKAKSPEKFNPVTLGDYMVNKVRRLQWGTPGAVTAREYGGHFRRWHHDEGVCYREIKVAIDLFCEDWPGIDVPAGRLFIKQRFTWITRAKEEIYQQELPVKQAANRAMWDQIQADLDNWLSENPAATKEQEDAMTAALWQTWKQDPRYAISYT